MTRQAHLPTDGQECLTMSLLKDRVTEARQSVNMAPAEFARRLGISKSALSQIENGATKSLALKTALSIQSVTGFRAEWLMDGSLPQRRSESNVEPGPDIRGGVPLISWVQAGAWSDVVDNFAPGEAEEWLPSPRVLSPSAFALRVRGESMKNPHGKPSYDDGDIIYVDPNIQAKHGDRVVVRLEDSKEATFKQLIIEGERRYLKALNPAWPEPIIEINGNATICGVVMGRWVPE